MDQVARDEAMAVKAEIKSHEAVCAERWASACAAITELKAAISRQTTLNMAAQAFVITILIGVAAWLAARVI